MRNKFWNIILDYIPKDFFTDREISMNQYMTRSFRTESIECLLFSNSNKLAISNMC